MLVEEQGWDVDETLHSLVRKAGYRGKVDVRTSLINQIKIKIK